MKTAVAVMDRPESEKHELLQRLRKLMDRARSLTRARTS